MLKDQLCVISSVIYIVALGRRGALSLVSGCACLAIAMDKQTYVTWWIGVIVAGCQVLLFFHKSPTTGHAHLLCIVTWSYFTLLAEELNPSQTNLYISSKRWIRDIVRLVDGSRQYSVTHSPPWCYSSLSWYSIFITSQRSIYLRSPYQVTYPRNFLLFS